MRALFALLIMLAAVLGTPAMATPAAAQSHRSHCADMPMAPVQHEQKGQAAGCCAVASPSIADEAASVPTVASGAHMLPAIRLADGRATGGLWSLDPPPPRLI